MKMVPKPSPAIIPEEHSELSGQVITLTAALSSPGSIESLPSTSSSLPSLVSFSTAALTDILKTSQNSVSTSKNGLKTVTIMKPTMAPMSAVTLATSTQNTLSKHPTMRRRNIILGRPVTTKLVNALAKESPQQIPEATSTVSSLPPVTSTTEKKITEAALRVPVCGVKEKRELLWSRPVIEKLIALFKERPYLYDRSDPFFWSSYMKKKALADITAELTPIRPNTTAQDVDKKWKSLRQQFLVSLLLREDGNDLQPEDSTQRWLYDHMKFLIPFMKYYDGLNGDRGKVEADTNGKTERIGKSFSFVDLEPLQIPNSPSDGSGRGDSSKHTYCKEPPPNCRQENGDKSAGQPAVTTRQGKGADQVDGDIELSQSEDNDSFVPKNTLPTRKRCANSPPEVQEVSTWMNTALTSLNHLLSSKRRESDDECDLYGKLIAKKLRQFTEIERQELMHDIDGLILTRRQKLDPQVPNLSPNSPSSRSSSPSTSQC